MNVLEVTNLSVQYPGAEGASEIVKDISFTVEEGSITGIVGQSGSGKSTAMLAVMGLLDGRASVRYGQITETVRKRKGCGRKEAAAQAEELLETVGIRNPALRMRQYPFELSGGMRQRVVLAIALACEPDLIIADEPTTALDAVVQAQILQLLRRMVRETGTALLLVSHDMGVTAAMCRNVYVMHGGRIIGMCM